MCISYPYILTYYIVGVWRQSVTCTPVAVAGQVSCYDAAWIKNIRLILLCGVGRSDLNAFWIVALYSQMVYSTTCLCYFDMQDVKKRTCEFFAAILFMIFFKSPVPNSRIVFSHIISSIAKFVLKMIYLEKVVHSHSLSGSM